MKCKITIFTPTFNRKQLLLKCYNSLKKQSNKNFIWLIIDDGSTDGTELLVEKWKQEKSINIEYILKCNGGKHTAHNLAVNKCNSDYFLILDSDDYLSNECIEKLLNYIEITNNDDSICGVIGNRYNSVTGKVIGKDIPNVKFASGIELYQKYGFKGDTLRMYKTKVLKDYVFPEIKDEKFIYENVVFDRIDLKYKFLVIRDKLYYGSYNEDGYTNNSNRLKYNNPIGYSLSLKSSSETAINFQKRINWTILYIIWCRKFKIKNVTKNYNNKLLYILLYPIALILYLIKKPPFFFNIFSEGGGA